jgi:magnesium chelatase subunit I
LVYEGEQEGAAYVAQNLIASAIHTFFPGYSQNREARKPDVRPDLIEWFFAESGFELLDDAREEI